MVAGHVLGHCTVCSFCSLKLFKLIYIAAISLLVQRWHGSGNSGYSCDILVLKFSQLVQCLYLRRGGFSVIKVISQCVPAIREKTKYVRMLKAGLRAISLFPFVSLTPGDISPARGEMETENSEITSAMKYCQII